MEFDVTDLGLIDFYAALELQRQKFSQIKEARLPSSLILCQHYPVVTLGRQAKPQNLLVAEKELKKRGIAVYKIERGGDVTYHGPGQIVVYPIFNLALFKKDIHFFLRKLEEVVIRFLAHWDIAAVRYPGLTGVWVEKKKIASLGIAIRQWITLHGLSINIKKNDLEHFSLIRPCGMPIQMTALEEVLGREVEMESIKPLLIEQFRRIFLSPFEARYPFQAYEVIRG